jgi:hypothetical protein
MQLTKNRGGDLRCRLLASSCALLATASAKADTGDLNYDFDLLYYSESGRVKAIEPTVVWAAEPRPHLGIEHPQVGMSGYRNNLRPRPMP